MSEVGPLIDTIRADTGMSATVAGALGSIPFACMGIFAMAGAPFLLRFGARGLIAASLILLMVATVTRALMPTAALIVIATVPVGVAIALMGLALPGVLKLGFPRRTGAAMGAYVAALSVGAAVTALTIVPLTNWLGSWRAAFAASATTALVAVPLWLLLPRSADRADPGTEEADDGRPTRAALSLTPPRGAFLLAALFGLQSMCFAATTNWLPALYHQAGWTVAAAARTVALVSILIVPGALVIPALSDRGDRRKWLVATGVLMAAGMLGFAFAPTQAPWLWIVLFAIGCGALFPLTLTLPQDVAQSEYARTELTAWVLGLGYLLSGCGPLVVGALYDLTGEFVLPMALLGGMGGLIGVLALAPFLRRAPEATAAPSARVSV